MIYIIFTNDRAQGVRSNIQCLQMREESLSRGASQLCSCVRPCVAFHVIPRCGKSLGGILWQKDNDLGVQMRSITMSLCSYLHELSDVFKPRDLGSFYAVLTSAL